MRSVVSRRELLGTILAAPLCFSSRLAGQSQERQREGPIRISLAAYSLREELTAGDLDLFGFIDWCAQIGLSGAELTSYYFSEPFDLAYLRRLRKRAFDSGVTVTGTAVRNNFCLPTGERTVQGGGSWARRGCRSCGFRAYSRDCGQERIPRLGGSGIRVSREPTNRDSPPRAASSVSF